MTATQKKALKALHFEILIGAPRTQVWTTMLYTPGYEQWTQSFCEGSHYIGSWEAGTPIRFCDPAGNGMISEIADHRPAEFVSIRHLGMIIDGKEDTDSEAVRSWTPCYENYRYSDAAGGTLVQVDMETSAEYETMFAEMWPRALQRLKALCEGQPL